MPDAPLERWRLILGQKADPEQETALSAEGSGMDRVLEALYDTDRSGKLGQSSPNINRWLGDIRKYFPTPVVQIMQRDALERLGLRQMLLEPELLSAIEPDVHLAGAILSLNKTLPVQTRETAREVVRRIVADVEQKIRNPLREAVARALRRSGRTRRPRSVNDIDWRRTIQANLRHYQPDSGMLIPDKVFGFGRKGQSLRQVILLVDQSGSMAGSVVYSGIFAAVLASIRALQTHVVAFDTAVVDLSMHLHDPVELLFATQLGGGTDIHKALQYAQTLVRAPQDAVVILISDLYEGGNRYQMLKVAQALRQSGATLIALLSLSDEGRPAYDHDNAAALAAFDIPVFACTPHQFPELIAAALAREDLRGKGFAI